MIFVHFQGKPFNITVIQVYALTNKAEEVEVEWFYGDLQKLLELILKKRHPFFGVSSKRSYRSSQIHSTSASLALVAGA